MCGTGNIAALIVCPARVKASTLPLCLCVRACICSLSVWLVATGPGNTLTQAHKDSHTRMRPLTHSHTLAHGQHEQAYIKDTSVSYACLMGTDRQQLATASRFHTD